MIGLKTGINSKAQADMMGYVASQVRRISDGEILNMNPDGTYSFTGSGAYKYSLDMLLNDSFEILGWVKKRNSEKMVEYKITDYINNYLHTMRVLKFLDKEDKEQYIRDCFDLLCQKLDEKFQYIFKWHYAPFEELINVVSTFSTDKIFTITMYKIQVPVDSYVVNLSVLKRDYKINLIIDEN